MGHTEIWESGLSSERDEYFKIKRNFLPSGNQKAL
jgi:hypothetical protein